MLPIEIMNTKEKRIAREGLGFGVIAGVVFGMAEVLGAAFTGASPFDPLRASASLALGPHALVAVDGTTYLVGFMVNLVLSAVFGLFYIEVDARFPVFAQTRYGQQLGVGLLFGALVWLLDFGIVAQSLFPWLRDTRPFVQLLMHALFFGAPLGLMMAATERRTHPKLPTLGVAGA